MEIERKYLIDGTLPFSLEPFSCHLIEQAYLCTAPVVRVRRQDQDYILTYKGSGLMAREEYNLPLTATSYAHLLTKADGNIITKKRYVIPLAGGLRAELDLFEGTFDGLRIVEIEFSTEKDANAFTAPAWFGEEVTFSSAYHNSTLSALTIAPGQTWRDLASYRR